MSRDYKDKKNYDEDWDYTFTEDESEKTYVVEKKSEEKKLIKKKSKESIWNNNSAKSKKDLKNSILSVVAVALSFFPLINIAAIILAMIDLIKRRDDDIPKKHSLSLLAIIICALNYLFFYEGIISLPPQLLSDIRSGFDTVFNPARLLESYNEISEYEASKDYEKALDHNEGDMLIEDEGEIANKEKSGDKGDKNKSRDKVTESQDIEIVKEYTLKREDGSSGYIYRFLIIHNKGKKTLKVSSQSLALDQQGKIVAAADSDFEALGANCTSVMREAYKTGEDVAGYDTKLSAGESALYESVIEDLEFEENDIDGGAVFLVTNRGERPAGYVKGQALFFKGDELVDSEELYFTDQDFEIKSGETVSKQINSLYDFDRIEFYLSGKRRRPT
ncbi:MAG: hypothetical protein K5931_06505 [Lachnospiraceae bacterium]|nr:hypothetical protein [Lachnospiraceae bacterium]